LQLICDAQASNIATKYTQSRGTASLLILGVCCLSTSQLWHKCDVINRPAVFDRHCFQSEGDQEFHLKKVAIWPRVRKFCSRTDRAGDLKIETLAAFSERACNALENADSRSVPTTKPTRSVLFVVIVENGTNAGMHRSPKINARHPSHIQRQSIQ
jgi:hypothetical protein